MPQVSEILSEFDALRYEVRLDVDSDAIPLYKVNKTLLLHDEFIVIQKWFVTARDTGEALDTVHRIVNPLTSANFGIQAYLLKMAS